MMPLIYLGIFLLAGSILLLEIALTRVFAIMLCQHFAYMVVSVAMLGFAAVSDLIQMLLNQTAIGRMKSLVHLSDCQRCIGLQIKHRAQLVRQVDHPAVIDIAPVAQTGQTHRVPQA